MEKRGRRQACWRPCQSRVKEHDGSRRCQTALGPPDGPRTDDRPVHLEEASEEKALEAAGQRRLYMTEAPVREQGRPMCCSLCGRRRRLTQRRSLATIEVILLQQSRMKPEVDAQPQATATTTKSCPWRKRSLTGPATQHCASSASAGPTVVGTSATPTPIVAMSEPATNVDAMVNEESCATSLKRAKTIIGIGNLRAGAHGRRVRPTQARSGPSVEDDDAVPPDATPRVSLVEGAGQATMLRAQARCQSESTSPDELLDPRLMGEGRAKELAPLRGQEFVIPRSALNRGTKTVRGKFVEDLQGGLVQSRFAAAKVARDVRYDVHDGKPGFKALRVILSLATTRDGKRRPPSVVSCDIVGAFVNATTDEVVTV